MISATKEMQILDGIAYAQNYVKDFLPINAINGDDSYWSGEPYYVWWLIDFEKPCFIDKFTVDTGKNDDKYNYFIEYSFDRLNWQELVEVNNVSGLIERNAKVNARYVKITFTYCSSGQNVKLYNFKAYGCQLDNVIELVKNEKFFATDYASSSGFIKVIDQNIEPNWQREVVSTTQVYSSLLYKNIDLTNVNQLVGYFAFTNKNKELKVNVEIRIDSVDGRVIAVMPMFRQYTPWCALGININKVEGIHDVYFVVTRLDEGQEMKICWLSFIAKPNMPKASTIDKAVDNSVNDYNVYFGLLHSHTSFSDGEETPEYAFDYARNVAKLDFLGITEHGNLFDEPFDCVKSKKLRDLNIMAKNKTVDGEFVALIGSETTWYNQFGHMNIYNEDLYINAYELKYNNVANYYDEIKKYPNSINQWNHPWSCGARHLDYFQPYDEKLDKIMYLIELNPYEDTIMSGMSYYVQALDLGWHVSPVGSQDNHHKDWGTANKLRTGVVAKCLTKECVIDAIKQHRVYFSCADSLKVLYYLNGQIMGSTVESNGNVEISFDATTTQDKITQIEIIGEQGKIFKTVKVDNKRVKESISLLAESKYYFVKVSLSNGEFAVTAPIWIVNG